MKYIIVQYKDVESPIIFSEDIQHNEVAPQNYWCSLVSAGYCKILNGKVVVWGGSLTLDLDSRPEDVGLISEALGI